MTFKFDKKKVTKFLPFIMLGYFANKLSQAFTSADGNQLGDIIMNWIRNVGQGLDCVVDIRKEDGRAVMRTETAGIAIISSTSVQYGREDLYLAITGDQCAVTDIRVKRA